MSEFNVRTEGDILGVPLYPDFQIESFENYAGRADLREFAAQEALQGLGKVVEARKFRTLARQIALANNALSRAHEIQSNDTDAREFFQGHAIKAMIERLQTIPEDTPQEYLQLDRFLAVAPTGSGKTVLEAYLLRLAGIGQAINAISDDRLRALLIVTSQSLMNQYLGVIGDDTFRRFLGDGPSLSAYWQHSKDTSGDITLVTNTSLLKAIEKGDIIPEDYDLAVFDEAHRGLSPKMIKNLGRLGTRLFMFTATPSYSEAKDLRKYAPHLEIGNLRDFVEDGILSPVRLLTFRPESGKKEDLLPTALSLAYHYIAEGLSVVAYCQPGGGCAQAQKLAAAINELLPDSKPARAIGTFNKPTVDGILQDFNDKKIRMLATTSMLREGWNAQVDVMITIGPNHSLLDLTQKVGRAMRPGKKEAILAEVIPSPDAWNQMCSIWSLFGLEAVYDNTLIGPRDDGLRRESGWESDRTPTDLARLPQELRKLLVHQRPVREITIAPSAYMKHSAPKEYIAVTALASSAGVPVPWLQDQLDRYGVPYVGVSPSNKFSDYERWYAPEAHDYLERNPAPKLADNGEMTLHQLALTAGVSEGFMKELAKTHNVVRVKKITQKYHKEREVFTAEGVATLLAEVEKIPVADETDIALGQACKEYGDHFVRNFCRANKEAKPTKKRRNMVHGVMGITMHLSVGQVQLIREARNGSQPFDPDRHITLSEIADIAGIRKHTVERHLTEDEKARIVYRRAKHAKQNTVKSFDREEGLEIAKRITPKREKLPPHLITLAAITTRVKADPATIARRLRSARPHFVDIGGRFGKIKCYPWENLRALEEEFGLRDNITAINYQKVATAPQDILEAHFDYSQEIQANFMPNENLAQKADTSFTLPGMSEDELDDFLLSMQQS